MFSDPTYQCQFADGYNKFSLLDQETKDDIVYFIKMNQLGFYTTNSQNGHKDAEYKDCPHEDVIKDRKFVPNFTIQRAYVSGLIEKSKLCLFEKTFICPSVDVPDNLDNLDCKEKEYNLVMMYSDGTYPCPRATLTCDLRFESNEIKNVSQVTKCQYLDKQFKITMSNCMDFNIEPKDCVYIEFIDLRWGQKDKLFKAIIHCLRLDET
jgi:hypothetical protein